MPYVCVRPNNVYLGEHSCRRYHYGDMTLVRDCCVADAKKYRELTLQNALTTQHAAYVQFEAAWNSLTDAEMLLVGDIIQNRGVAEGFSPHPGHQLELPLD